MKKILKEAYAEAKKVHKGLWLAAVVVPGGFVGITAFIAAKTAYKNYKKKEEENDRSNGNQG